MTNSQSNLLVLLKCSEFLFILLERKPGRIELTVRYIDFNTNVGKLKAVIHFCLVNLNYRKVIK